MPARCSKRTMAVLFASAMVGVGVPAANGQTPPGIPPQVPITTPAVDPGIVPPTLPGRDTPPPLPAPELSAFFVDAHGQPDGPLTAQQVIGRIQAGQVTPQTLVWKRGTANWVRAEEMGEFATAFREAPPPLPPAREFERYIVGTWESEIRQPGMVTQITGLYRADGTFTGIERVQMIGIGHAPPVTIPVSGRWSVEALTDKRFLLTLTPGDGSQPRSGTFQVIDDNTVRHEGQNVIVRRVSR